MPSIPIPDSPHFSDSDIFANAVAMLFGDEWWTAFSGGELTGPLIPMLEAVNTVVLCGISGMSLLVFAMGATSTANEGAIGGRKLHGFWWPLRAAFGISMTAPIAKGGLSIFQAILLMLLGWGGTLANNVWEYGVDHLARSNMTVINHELPPHIQEEARSVASIAFKAALTQNFYLKRQLDSIVAARELAEPTSDQKMVALLLNPISPWQGPAFEEDRHSSLGISSSHHNTEHYWRLRFGGPFEKGYKLQKGDFGGFDILGQVNDPMMIAKRNGIVAVYSVVEPVANDIVNGRPVDSGWLKSAMNAYLSRVLPIYQNFANYYPDHDLTREVEAFRKEAIKYGWASAGAYPLLMSQLGEEARERQFMAIKMIPVRAEKALEAFDDITYGTFSKTITKADSLFNAEESLEPGKTIQEASLGGDPENFFNKWVDYILGGKFFLQIWINGLEQSDPITFYTRWGHRLVDAGIAMWGVGFVTALKQGTVKAANDSVVGQVAGALTSGNSINAGVGGLLAGLEYVQTWLLLAVSGLLMVGAFFAYVFPALPLMYWVIAVLAYAFLILELMVAAPLWAASHALSTQDEGFAGEMGRKGYFQFLEILIRPLLYVVGFFGVFIFMRMAGWLVARLFELYYFSYSAASESSVFWTNGAITTLAMIMVLGGMYVYLFHWLYTEGLSNLPRKVINWIGGQGQTLGVAQGAEQMRAAIVGGLATVGSGSGSGGGGGGAPQAPGEPEEENEDSEFNDSGERVMPEFSTYGEFKRSTRG